TLLLESETNWSGFGVGDYNFQNFGDELSFSHGGNLYQLSWPNCDTLWSNSSNVEGVIRGEPFISSQLFADPQIFSSHSFYNGRNGEAEAILFSQGIVITLYCDLDNDMNDEISMVNDEMVNVYKIVSRPRSEINFLEHSICSEFPVLSVEGADLDGDGDNDIVAAGHRFNSSRFSWFENNGQQEFNEHTIDNSFNRAYSIYPADLDGDGDLDVIGTAHVAEEIAWWENDGQGGFTKYVVGNNVDYPSSCYVTDMDNDEDMDILVSSYGSDRIIWYENNGSQVFTEHNIGIGFDGAFSVYAADIDNDEDMDVVGAAIIDKGISWWENLGYGNFAEYSIDDNFDGAHSVIACDIDSDEDIDVIAAAYYDSEITWWENNGQQYFIEHLVAGNLQGAYSVDAKDLDNDGDLDILGVASLSGVIAWWQNDGNRNFTQRNIADNYVGVSCIRSLDMDLDGDMDILTGQLGTYGISWWENDLITQTAIQDTDELGPRSTSLSANYPNPFNSSTTIEYSLPEPGEVTIEIFDLLGRRVETLIDTKQDAGIYRVTWDAEEQASGVYFYRIKTGDYTDTRRMVLLK
ncbi:MAG: T9SS type A sorting domain-containing protein, partial [candidate division Zixibacteria bacterium]